MISFVLPTKCRCGWKIPKVGFDLHSSEQIDINKLVATVTLTCPKCELRYPIRKAANTIVRYTGAIDPLSPNTPN